MVAPQIGGCTAGSEVKGPAKAAETEGGTGRAEAVSGADGQGRADTLRWLVKPRDAQRRSASSWPLRKEN